jgi:hypothetical protein
VAHADDSHKASTQDRKAKQICNSVADPSRGDTQTTVTPLYSRRDVLGADVAFAEVALAHKFLLAHLGAFIWTTADASWGGFTILH